MVKHISLFRRLCLREDRGPWGGLLRVGLSATGCGAGWPRATRVVEARWSNTAGFSSLRNTEAMLQRPGTTAPLLSSGKLKAFSQTQQIHSWITASLPCPPLRGPSTCKLEVPKLWAVPSPGLPTYGPRHFAFSSNPTVAINRWCSQVPWTPSNLHRALIQGWAGSMSSQVWRGCVCMSVTAGTTQPCRCPGGTLLSVYLKASKENPTTRKFLSFFTEEQVRVLKAYL